MNPSYLKATDILDYEHPAVQRCIKTATADIDGDPAQRASALYRFVRDQIRYDPYYPFFRPEHYRSSEVLKSGRGFCVSKAALLCAMGRGCGIPSRLGFATVKNHLATRQLIAYLGSDLFVWHGFTEFYIDDTWVKATPAFNAELCARFNVAPLAFDGRQDSIYQQYTRDDQKFMEYIDFYGIYDDVPVAAIVAGFKETYGRERVQGWMDALSNNGDAVARDFEKEDPLE